MPVTDIQDSHREIFERSLAAEVEDNSTIPHKSYEDRITQDPPKGLYPPRLPEEGWGSGTLVHIADDLLPVLSGQARSSRYYGFVTGGSLPMAQLAEQAVVAMDQNVMVHMPRHSITTTVEDAALKGVLDLLNMDAKVFPGRTFTTGATGSNILGLACGREGVLEKRGASVSDLGLLGACMKAGVTQIRILTSGAHSTISKAASIVGIGRSNIVDLSYSTAEPWRLDINRVERELQVPGTAHIISVSAGEVNTGRFATTGLADMEKLRTLADKHNAWIHVDGAFGIFARHLPNTPEFQSVRRGAEGLELADSITADGHKCLNVPYDTGIFFCRHLDLQTRVCTNGFAAYLSGGAKGIPSPMNVGLENSRRWRALPVYTVLWSEGRRGMQEMFVNMVRMARALVEFIRSSEHYILMPDEAQKVEDTHIIVLFRAKDASLNEALVDRINETRDMFVSGTKWNGHTACRVAVSNWKVDVDKDIAVVSDILNKIAREHG